MHKLFLRTLLYLIVATLLASCTEAKVYKIGVAQCSKGPWREKVNQEMPAFIRTRCKGQHRKFG